MGGLDFAREKTRNEEYVKYLRRKVDRFTVVVYATLGQVARNGQCRLRGGRVCAQNHFCVVRTHFIHRADSDESTGV